MAQTYQFNITGMTCHACAALITMDLAEAGFTPRTIDHVAGRLIIDLDPSAVAAVQQTIEQSGQYKITATTIIPHV